MSTATDPTMPEKHAVKGSCHCKYITYEAMIPKNYNTTNKCNCTMCQKPGFVTIGLSTEGTDFKLLTPSSESDVKYYQYRSKDCYRFFCDRCGVQVWGHGKYSFDGTEYKFFSVNMNTVDQPQEGFDPSGFKVTYVDGLTDSWMKGHSDKPFPGGVA